MPARRARSARRRSGPGSSLVRSCAACLLLLMPLSGRMSVNVPMVVVVLVLWRGPAKAGELGETHRPLSDAGTLEKPVDHLVLEHCGFYLAHRIRVLQVSTPRLIRVRVGFYQRIQPRQHALAIHLQPLALHDVGHEEPQRHAAPGGLQERLGPRQLARITNPEPPRSVDL